MLKRKTVVFKFKDRESRAKPPYSIPTVAVSAELDRKHSMSNIILYTCGGPSLRHVSDDFVVSLLFWLPGRRFCLQGYFWLSRVSC